MEVRGAGRGGVWTPVAAFGAERFFLGLWGGELTRQSGDSRGCGGCMWAETHSRWSFTATLTVLVVGSIEAVDAVTVLAHAFA